MAKFNDMCQENKDTLMKMSSYYHYRNDKQNHDGSTGEIKITPAELNELLTQAYLEGYSDH